MPIYFFDTSALAKHYHQDTGTPKVDRILAEQGSRHFISRLSAIEIQSVFASKVRNQVITDDPAIALITPTTILFPD
ncbi:MAG: type II toxin-antitoxin system VapC family toxin [Acidobacteria bacterium]|nr:type II toxin-antitoxin system VapC family toxin [Acidobacteriota bacterium]